jgi:cation diffusion facilitator family transporter
MPIRQDRKTKHGEGHFLLMSLRNQPLTREEISGTYSRFGSLLGMITPAPGTKKYQKWQKEIDDGLSHLVNKGLVAIDKYGVYKLTEDGINEANKTNQDLQKLTQPLRAFFSNGQTTAKISIIVNVLLSALKLGVGFIFNSMALIADGFDNAVDVVSAIVILLGIKYRRELLSTVFILFVMFITGVGIVYESVARLIHPQAVEAGVFTIIAAVISGLVCYLMSLYQYAVGKNTGSLCLISQSIDSKNHAFVAGGVLVGIVFAVFGIFIIDSLVGLIVAILILKSAIELTIETSRVAGGEELNLSRFARAEEKAFEKHRRNYFKSWLLFCLREANTKHDIVSQYKKSFTTEGLPFIDQFGFLKGFDFENHVDSLFKEVIDEGLAIVKDMNYQLTDKGQKLLSRTLVYQRYVDAGSI